MSYSPDPLGHTQLADRADLWCSQDGRYCSESDPCPCCGSVAGPEAKAPKAAKVKKDSSVAGPEVEYGENHGGLDVRHVSDSDTGEAGESTG